MLRGNQVFVSEKYIDIIFGDRFGQDLIIELKRGVVVRKDIAQLIDYEGYFLSPDNPTTRVMLIGNRIPNNMKLSLDHHGFEWKEITIDTLKKYLQSVRDLLLLARIKDLDFDSQRQTEPNKTNEISSGRNKSSKGLPRLNIASTFNELSEIIRIRSKVYPTNYLDLLLLENESKHLSEILSIYATYADLTNPIVKIVGIKEKH